jgi:hypothetical protein
LKTIYKLNKSKSSGLVKVFTLVLPFAKQVGLTLPFSSAMDDCEVVDNASGRGRGGYGR